MNLTDLQKTLRAVEPAAVLVSPRVLEDIVRQHWNLSGVFGTVPHRSNFIIDRQTLFLRHVDQEDLVLGPDEYVSEPTIIVLAWPSNDDLAKKPSDAILLRYWQEMFHASVHLALEKAWNDGKLTQADLRGRVAEIGQAEFEEIKNVLVQDGYLPADADERTVYTEFVALFLEQYYFLRGLLAGTFPGVRDQEAMRQLLERDVNGDALFRRTRLKGAGDPVVRTISLSQESHEFYDKLIASSERALKSGNLVLSAIQKRRAARVAPPDLGKKTVVAAYADVHRLAQRLKSALSLDDAGAAAWQADLTTLLDMADQGTRPAEAAMLYDLQKACLDSEQEIYALDLVEWIRSFGRRPIKRPLPSQRLVRLTRHVRSAAQRLTLARLTDDDRKHLGNLLQAAQDTCDNRLRERFRPIFITALEDVGLKPRNLPERVVFAKMIEELIDRVLVNGFLTFSDLRDTLSRNLLKLPDLADPEDFIKGDALIRLDRRLTTLLDGVYYRGDFYLRWLERFTSFCFGWGIGRTLTRYVTLPFGAAFLILAALDRFILPHFHVSLFFVQGPVNQGGPTEVFDWRHVLRTFLPYWLPLSVIILGLLHSPRVRAAAVWAVNAVWQPLRALLIDKPLWLVRNPLLRKFLKTSTFRLLLRYVLKPSVICLLLWCLDFLLRLQGKELVFTEYLRWPGLLVLFLAVNFLINIWPGEAASQTISHGFVQFAEDVRAGLLMRILIFTISLFKQVMRWIEAVLHGVDDWLRFREGDSRLSMVLRALLTVLWIPFAFVVRFNIIVLIEPCLNPLKLPISSIAFKFYLPFYYLIPAYLARFGLVAEAIGFWITFWFADVFGFFFWEIKENWSLYRANRSRTLRPIIMGPHGETLPALLRPGFHSGTVPKLFARLRNAERDAHQTGNWSAVRSCKADLDNVAQAVRQFLTRDFIALLAQHPAWQGESPAVGKIDLATNRIRVELVNPRYADAPVTLEFEYRADWLLAGFDKFGWFRHLTPQQLRPLHNALVTLYKLAGVDIVREQFQAILPASAALDLRPQGLAVRVDGRPVPVLVYNPPIPAAALTAGPTDGVAVNGQALPNERRLLFRAEPVTWEDCVASWQYDPAHAEQPMLARDVKLLPPKE